VSTIFGSSVLDKASKEKVNLNFISSSKSDSNNPILRDSLHYLFKWADLYLTVIPNSVMEKKQLPASGDRHDFLSLAPYCWPDPKSPDGLPYKCLDSLGVNPAILEVPDKENMKDMITRVKTLSLAYHFSQNESYASKAADLLRVWFLDGHTKMNPNMKYSEAVPGRNNGTNHGIIGAKQLPEVIESIHLIENSPSWTSQDQQRMKGWFSHYLDWLLHSPTGIKEGKSKNNHGTWYDVQASAIALFVNKTDIAEKILKKWMDKQIAIQIQPDGRQPLELSRPTSLQYSIFNLLGLFKLANTGEQAGIDLWNFKTPQGAGLQKALDYLMPYLFNEHLWPEKQDGPIKYDYVASILCQAIVHYPSNESYDQTYKSMDRKTIIANIDNLMYKCNGNDKTER
jgi:hypothetical protein